MKSPPNENDEKKFTNEQIRDAILRRLSGECREDIAISCGVNKYADIIGPAPKSKGWKRNKPGKLSEESKSEIITLMKFFNYTDIATFYDITIHMLTNFVRKVKPAEGWGKRPPAKGLTNEQKADVVSRRRNGETIRNIAATHGVSGPAVHYLLKKEVHEESPPQRTRRRKLTKEQKKDAILRRKSGETLAAIAAIHGVSVPAIHTMLKRAIPEQFPNRRTKLTDEQKQDVIMRRKNGETLKSIALVYKTSVTHIYRVSKDSSPSRG